MTKRSVSDKVLHDKPFNISKASECDGYKRDIASMGYTFFNKLSATHKGTHAKFLKKLTRGLKNDAENLVNFHASSYKSGNL